MEENSLYKIKWCDKPNDATYVSNIESELENPEKLTLEIVEGWEKAFKEKTGDSPTSVQISFSTLKELLSEGL